MSTSQKCGQVNFQFRQVKFTLTCQDKSQNKLMSNKLKLNEIRFGDEIFHEIVTRLVLYL